MDVSWLVEQWSQLGEVAGKAALMYESKGDLTVVPQASGPVPELVRLGIEDGVGWTEPPDDGGQDRATSPTTPTA